MRLWNLAALASRFVLGLAFAIPNAWAQSSANDPTPSGATAAPTSQAAVSPWKGTTLTPMGWEYVGYTPEVAAFYELPVVRLKGELPRLWQRFEYSTEQQAEFRGYRSVRFLVEYDCNRLRVRSIEISYFLKNNLEGDYFSATGGPSAWEYPAPGTIDGHLQEIVCGTH
jgi:hypothetical protein